MPEPIFAELRELSANPVAAAERLVAWLTEQGQFHQAFDARLLVLRLRLGLPVIWTGTLDDLDESTRNAVEHGYVDACRATGLALLEHGHPRDAWYFLRHVPDRAETTSLLADYEPDDENREEYVELAVHEGLAPARGFQQVLSHYGICNAITLFDSAMHGRTREERQAVAPLLIADLHAQLVSNLRADIAKEAGTPPREVTVAELIADRDWLFGEHAYHIDTSHLNAVVRFAREVDDPVALRQALDLCEYGQRLDAQFQFASEEPFADTYAAHAIFLRGLLATPAGTESADWKAAHDYFRGKAANMPYEQQGSLPAEVYVAFLARTGHQREALQALAEFLPAGAMTAGFAPSLAELAHRSGDFQQLAEIGAAREDVLTFATGLLANSGK